VALDGSFADVAGRRGRAPQQVAVWPQTEPLLVVAGDDSRAGEQA
jgi:hypothetical protein